MNRRRFVRTALVLLGAGVALLAGAYRVLRGRGERKSLAGDAGSGLERSGGLQPSPGPGAAVEARLRHQLAYLEFDDALLARFAADLASDPRHEAVEESDSRLVFRFLLSTDFFQHGGDEDRQLQYVAYYEPYATPCYNPLARFD